MKAYCHSAAVVVLAVFVSIGCGPRDPRQRDLAPVSGTVLYNGSPVSGAMIQFYHEDATKQGGVAISGSDGKFQLSTYTGPDGTYPGNYRVVVSKTEVQYPISDQELLQRERDGKQLPEGKIVSILPENYRSKETTDIAVTVSKRGSKDLRLELTD